MKTFIVIAVTAAIAWTVAGFVHGARAGAERLWLMSAVKAPGRMAISDIQSDMNAGRYELAKAKTDILMDEWRRFDAEPPAFRGSGIGDIMVAFSKLDANSVVAHSKPASAKDGSRK